MDVAIETASPRDPQAQALLGQSHALMRSLYAPEDSHFLDIDALSVPEITLYLARRGGAPLGTIALRRADGYGEVKSFFVTPEARGLGVGRALLEHVEAVARRDGLSSLKLETGTGLDAAAALYQAQGFRPCEPFGSYRAAAASRFFEKSLAQPL